MAKFENDLDLNRAKREVSRVKKTFETRIGKDKSLMKIINTLEKNKRIECFIFSKSIAFRIGKSSIKTISGFSGQWTKTHPI